MSTSPSNRLAWAILGWFLAGAILGMVIGGWWAYGTEGVFIAAAVGLGIGTVVGGCAGALLVRRSVWLRRAGLIFLAICLVIVAAARIVSYLLRMRVMK